METQLVQKEKLYDDKIKVRFVCVCVCCTLTTMSVFELFFHHDWFIRLDNYRLPPQCEFAKWTLACFVWFQVLEAQIKEDLADKESLEARRAQQEEESRENCKLISEQKAVRKHDMLSMKDICYILYWLWDFS